MERATMSIPSSKPSLHCLRIVYANGDVDIRHNIRDIEIHADTNSVHFLPYGTGWFSHAYDVAQLFITPQDSFRRSI
jgi:hypothetical protein